MRKTPVQDALIRTLREARTTELWPVWVTWDELSRKVYGTNSERQRTNLRKTADKCHQILCLKYPGGRNAGARLRQSPEESWLEDWTLETTARKNWSADFSRYTPPTKEEILRAFHVGLSQRNISPRVNVGTLTKLVNDHCGTTFDPSDSAWAALGYQLTWEDRRGELLERIAGSINTLHKFRESAAAESRKITVGPFRLDPLALSHCPCCQQSVPTNFPIQIARAHASRV
ncbi:hypothetical protein [Streptomyces sp. SR-10]|uniref:hypothetical protein n=1 Tax=Streptomyces sp. SR-10 TaxID=3416442 RepID=UPI003CECDE7A